jgi:hypothetical protein
MAKKILLLLLVLVAGACTFILTRPDSFHVERSATIAAPSEVVFARLDNFHAWADWSPWEKLDPKMQRTYSGPDSGPGAMYAWTGNDKVGEGKMTIVEATPTSKVTTKLEFIKPFQATNTATFVLVPEGASTKVTWSMDGKNNFMSKAFSLVMDMDKTVGADFEKGLANLNTIAAGDARTAAAAAPDTAAAQ